MQGNVNVRAHCMCDITWIATDRFKYWEKYYLKYCLGDMHDIM